MSGDLLDTPQAGPAVIRGGTIRTLGYVAGILMSAAATPLMIRHLGVVDFGRYVTVISIITIVAALTDVGLTNIGVREYTLRPVGERQRLMGNLLGMRLALTVVGAAAAIGFAALAGYPHVVVLGTVLASVGLILQVAQTTYQVPLSSELELSRITLLEFTRQLITVLFIVALVVVGARLLPFYLITVVAGVIVLAMNMAMVARRTTLVPTLEWPEWTRLVRDAPAYAVASAIGFIYFRIEVVLVSLISSSRQIGFFSASFRIVEIISGIPLLASLSVFPLMAKAAHEDRDRFRYMLDRMFQAYAIAGIAVAVAFVLGAPVGIHVLAGGGFGPSIPVLRIMGASLAATFLVSNWGFALLAVRRHTALMLANLGALALAIGLTVALAPAHGALGAAIALAVTECALAGTYALLLYGPGSDLRVSFTKVPVMLGAAGVGIGAGFASGLPSALATILGLILYAAILLVTKSIPEEAIDAFRGGGA